MPEIKKLRYVTDHVHTFEDYDHNDHVDNWKAEVEILREAGVSESLVQRIENIVKEMRYVSYGDYYYAEDHNRFVWAFRELLKVFEELGASGDAMDEFRSVVEQMETIRAFDWYYDYMHNLFAKAWELVPELNKQVLAPPVPTPPAMEQVFVEDWSITGPPTLSQVYAEPWSYEEPPAMEQKYAEDWSA